MIHLIFYIILFIFYCNHSGHIFTFYDFLIICGLSNLSNIHNYIKRIYEKISEGEIDVRDIS
jgi:hypothetical protein